MLTNKNKAIEQAVSYYGSGNENLIAAALNFAKEAAKELVLVEDSLGEKGYFDVSRMRKNHEHLIDTLITIERLDMREIESTYEIEDITIS